MAYVVYIPSENYSVGPFESKEAADYYASSDPADGMVYELVRPERGWRKQWEMAKSEMA